jgi:hypothetical protein
MSHRITANFEEPRTGPTWFRGRRRPSARISRPSPGGNGRKHFKKTAKNAATAITSALDTSSIEIGEIIKVIKAKWCAPANQARVLP